MAKKTNTGKSRKSVKKAGKWVPLLTTVETRYILIALAVITGVAMSPIITNDFISLDDENFILINPVVQDHDFAGAFEKQLHSPHYKPLVYSSWIIEHSIFGNSPFIYHFNNWLLHIVNTLLVFFCVSRIAGFWEMTRDSAVPIAFFTALLFGVHPLHVESVAWAIERKDVMFAAFYLAGMLSYLKYLETRKSTLILLTGGFYLLSLMSKSMGITLPGILFLMDLAYGRRDWKAMILEKWPLYIGFGLALYMYGVILKPIKPYAPERVQTSLQGLGDGAPQPPPSLSASPSLYQEFAIANYRYLFFFFHTLFPVKLAIVYAREFLLGAVGSGIHAMLLVTAGIWSLPVFIRKYRLEILVGLSFFTMAISPILIEEGVGSNFGSDRYTYIPSIGILLLLAILFIKAFPRHLAKGISLGGGILLGLSLLFAVGAFRQSLKWGNSEELFTQAIDNYPDNWVALQYRGGAIDLANPEQALADFARSLELNPNRYSTYYSRGTLLLSLGRYPEAIQDFSRVIELEPRHWKSWVNRANCYRDLGDDDRALEDYNHVLANFNNFDKALNNRGVAYLHKDMFDKALADFNKVIELDPTYVNAYINRAALYIDPGVRDYEKAVADYTTCLQYEPDNWQALYFRAYSLQKLGRYDEALSSVNQALAVRSDKANFYYTRAQILRQLGRRDESIADARKAQQMGIDVDAQYLR